MNKITCDMCMDLMPLVKDGIASADSREAVEFHLETCAVCRGLYHGQAPPVINTEKAFHKLKRQIQIFSAMLMLFGIFFGVNLTAGSNVFYNSLIMPIIGALGYMLLRLEGTIYHSDFTSDYPWNEQSVGLDTRTGTSGYLFITDVDSLILYFRLAWDGNCRFAVLCL